MKGRCTVLKQDVVIQFLQLCIMKNMMNKHSQASVELGGAGDPTHHRCCPISDLLILQVSKFTQDLCSWVLHFQQLQDGCSIVGDGHVLSKQPQNKTDKQTGSFLSLLSGYCSPILFFSFLILHHEVILMLSILLLLTFSPLLSSLEILLHLLPSLTACHNVSCEHHNPQRLLPVFGQPVHNY